MPRVRGASRRPAAVAAFSAGAAFARDPRGAASIELGFGAAALLAIAMACFDFYSRVEADTAAARMAVTMGEYVSRETEPDGDQVAALGRFLYEYELGVPASLVYVVSAVRKPSGDDPEDPPEVVWVDTIRFGDETATAELADACGRFGVEGGAASLPEGFAMGAGEVIVATEICARLSREGSLTGRFVSGDIYSLHALPAREPGSAPAKPVRTAPEVST